MMLMPVCSKPTVVTIPKPATTGYTVAAIEPVAVTTPTIAAALLGYALGAPAITVVAHPALG